MFQPLVEKFNNFGDDVDAWVNQHIKKPFSRVAQKLEESDKRFPILGKFRQLDKIGMPEEGRPDSRGISIFGGMATILIKILILILIILSIYAFFLFKKSYVQGEPVSFNHAKEDANTDLPAIRLQLQSWLKFFELNESSLQGIEVEDGDGSIFRTTKGRIPRASSAFTSASVEKESVCNEFTLSKVQSTTAADKFSSSLRALLTPETSSFYEHNIDVYLRLDDNQLDNLKKCQFSVALVNNGEYRSVLKNSLPGTNCSSIYFNPNKTISTFTTTSSSWKFDTQRQCSDKKDGKCWNLQKLSATVDQAKFNTLRQRFPGQKYMDWTVLVSYVGNFQHVAQDILCSGTPISEINPSLWIDAYKPDKPITRLTLNATLTAGAVSGRQILFLAGSSVARFAVDTSSPSLLNTTRVAGTNQTTLAVKSLPLNIPPIRPSEVPETWTCTASFYNAKDGCDCNCGAVDPDCDTPGVQLYNCNDGQYCSVLGMCVDSVTTSPVNRAWSNGVAVFCTAVTFPGEVFQKGFPGLLGNPSAVSDLKATCDSCPFDCLEKGQASYDINGVVTCQQLRTATLDSSLQGATVAAAFQGMQVGSLQNCSALFPQLGSTVNCSTTAPTSNQTAALKQLGFSSCGSDGTTCADLNQLCIKLRLTIPAGGFDNSTFQGQKIRIGTGQGNQQDARLMKLEPANVKNKTQDVWLQIKPISGAGQPKRYQPTHCNGLLAGTARAGEFELGVLVPSPEEEASCFPSRGVYPVLITYPKPPTSYYGSYGPPINTGGSCNPGQAAGSFTAGSSAPTETPARRRESFYGDDLFEPATEVEIQLPTGLEAEAAFIEADRIRGERLKRSPMVHPLPAAFWDAPIHPPIEAFLQADILYGSNPRHSSPEHPLNELMSTHQRLHAEYRKYKMAEISARRGVSAPQFPDPEEAPEPSGPQRRGAFHREPKYTQSDVIDFLYPPMPQSKRNVYFKNADGTKVDSKPRNEKYSIARLQQRQGSTGSGGAGGGGGGGGAGSTGFPPSTGGSSAGSYYYVDPCAPPTVPSGVPGANHGTLSVDISRAARPIRVGSLYSDLVSHYQVLTTADPIPKFPQLTPWGTLSINDFENTTNNNRLAIRNWSPTGVSFSAYFADQGAFRILMPSGLEVATATVTAVEQFNLTGWTCSKAYYNANDGCDCDCGIYDPDCARPRPSEFTGRMYCATAFYDCVLGNCGAGAYGCSAAGVCTAAADLSFSPPPIDQTALNTEILVLSQDIPPYLAYDRLVTAIPNDQADLIYVTTQWKMEHVRPYLPYNPEDRDEPQFCENWASPDRMDLDVAMFMYPIKKSQDLSLKPLCDTNNALFTQSAELVNDVSARLLVTGCKYTNLRGTTHCSNETRNNMVDIFDQDLNQNCLDEMPPTGIFEWVGSTPVNEKYADIDTLRVVNPLVQFVSSIKTTFVFTHDSDANSADAGFRSGRPPRGDRLEVCNNGTCACVARVFSGATDYQGLGAALARPADLPANVPLYYFSLSLIADPAKTAKLAKGADTWPSGGKALADLIEKFTYNLDKFAADSVDGSTKRQGLPIGPGLEFSLKAFVSVAPTYERDYFDNLALSGWSVHVSSTSVSSRVLDYNERYECHVIFEIQFAEDTSQTIHQPEQSVKMMIDGIGASLAYMALGFVLLETWQSWGGYKDSEKGDWIYPFDDAEPAAKPAGGDVEMSAIPAGPADPKAPPLAFTPST
eukprot:TRINITY_DN130_c0_g1_i1.p1 TRINITY_DN130_c0_g1~~TRINITY_DN130_c0_g1_i1.p1  ORF type:complete len:1711 (-),score=272.24 TRINITY_DN130_c0_g1_i1:46-5178(-)